MKCKRPLFFSAILLFCLVPAWADSLKQAVQFAINSDPEIRVAAYARNQSQALVTEKRAGYYPVGDVSVGWGREESRNPTLSDLGLAKRNLARREAAITLDENIFNGGETSQRVEQAKQLLKKSAAALGSTEDKVILKAVTVYLDVLRYAAIQAFASNNVNTHRAMLKKISRLYQGGAASASDEKLAESRLSLAEKNFENAKNNFNLAKTAYLITIGREPRQLQLPALPANQLPATLERLFRYTEKNNPALKEFLWQYRSDQSAIKVDEAAFYPKINIKLSTTNNNNVDGITGRNRDVQGMVYLKYNFMNGGENFALVNQAQQKMYEDRSRLLVFKRDLKQRIMVKWQTYHSLEKQLQQEKQYNLQTKQVVKNYKKQFLVGKKALFNVLDAEKDMFDSEVSYINVKFDHMNTFYELLALMGKVRKIF